MINRILKIFLTTDNNLPYKENKPNFDLFVSRIGFVFDKNGKAYQSYLGMTKDFKSRRVLVVYVPVIKEEDLMFEQMMSLQQIDNLRILYHHLKCTEVKIDSDIVSNKHKESLIDKIQNY